MVIKAVGAAATKNSLIASAFATDPERIRVLIDALWTRGPRGVVARSTMMTLGSRSKLVQDVFVSEGGPQRVTQAIQALLSGSHSALPASSRNVLAATATTANTHASSSPHAGNTGAGSDDDDVEIALGLVLVLFAATPPAPLLRAVTTLLNTPATVNSPVFLAALLRMLRRESRCSVVFREYGHAVDLEGRLLHMQTGDAMSTLLVFNSRPKERGPRVLAFLTQAVDSYVQANAPVRGNAIGQRRNGDGARAPWEVMLRPVLVLLVSGLRSSMRLAVEAGLAEPMFHQFIRLVEAHDAVRGNGVGDPEAALVELSCCGAIFVMQEWARFLGRQTPHHAHSSESELAAQFPASVLAHVPEGSLLRHVHIDRHFGEAEEVYVAALEVLHRINGATAALHFAANKCQAQRQQQQQQQPSQQQEQSHVQQQQQQQQQQQREHSAANHLPAGLPAVVYCSTLTLLEMVFDATSVTVHRGVHSAVSLIMRRPRVLARALLVAVLQPMGPLVAAHLELATPFWKPDSGGSLGEIGRVVVAARALVRHATSGPVDAAKLLCALLSSCSGTVAAGADGGGNDRSGASDSDRRDGGVLDTGAVAVEVASLGAPSQRSSPAPAPRSVSPPPVDPACAVAMLLQLFGLDYYEARRVTWPPFWPGTGGRRVAFASAAIAHQPGFVDAFEAGGGVDSVATLLLCTPASDAGVQQVVAPLLRWLDDWTHSTWHAEPTRAHQHLWMSASTTVAVTPKLAEELARVDGVAKRLTRAVTSESGAGLNLFRGVVDLLDGDNDDDGHGGHGRVPFARVLAATICKYLPSRKVDGGGDDGPRPTKGYDRLVKSAVQLLTASATGGEAPGTHRSEGRHGVSTARSSHSHGHGRRPSHGHGHGHGHSHGHSHGRHRSPRRRATIGDEAKGTEADTAGDKPAVPVVTAPPRELAPLHERIQHLKPLCAKSMYVHGELVCRLCRVVRSAHLACGTDISRGQCWSDAWT